MPIRSIYTFIASRIHTLTMRRVRRRSSTLFRPDAGSLDAPGMESVDQILKAQVEGEFATLHNACYIVMNREGMFTLIRELHLVENTLLIKCFIAGTIYSKAYGSRDLARAQPIDVDSFHWIASLTKLSTAVAAMIAVEQGLITLDQNVREIVPELAELDVLEGFDDDGTPRLRKCTASISLR